MPTFFEVLNAFSGGLLLLVAVAGGALFPRVAAVRSWSASWALLGLAGLVGLMPADRNPTLVLALASGLALALGALTWWGLTPSQGRGALPRTLLWGGTLLVSLPVFLGLTGRDPAAWMLVALWSTALPWSAVVAFLVERHRGGPPSVRAQSGQLLLALVVGPGLHSFTALFIPLGLLPLSLLGALLVLRALIRFDARFPHHKALPFVVERTQDPVLFLNADGSIQAVNPALCALLDRDESTLLGLRPSDLGAEVESRRLLGPLESLTFPDWEGTASLADRQGRAILVHLVYRRVHNPAREAVGAVVLIHDQRIPGRLDLAAHEDPLTGLSNRRWVLELLEAEFLRARRGSSDLSVLWVTLVPSGDAALRQVGAVTRGGIRRTDFAGRVSDHEILVVLPETSPDRARLVACRLAKNFALASEGGTDLRIGIVGLDQNPATADDLLALARDAVPGGPE